MTSRPTLSVVVCSYNGASKLGDCLDALAEQRVTVEVLVVDDGSTDGTEAAAQRHGYSVIRHEQNRGISAARNTGLRNSTTSIVAFCDDDCIPPVNWTEQLLAAWTTNPEVTMIGGLVKFDRPNSFAQRYLVYRNPFAPLEIALAHHPSVWYRFARQLRPPRLSATKAFPVYSVLGGNMSVNCERALEVGGFDENLIFGEGEEVALCEVLRAHFGESSVVVDPRVILSHRFDPTIAKTWRRSFAYGRGAAERWRKNGGLPSLPVVGPVAIVSTAVLAPISWPLGLSVGMLMLATPWASWISLPSTNFDGKDVAYPLVALVDDLASALGFARGLSGKVMGEWKSRKR
jgi:GT2 family glycosyltransferase